VDVSKYIESGIIESYALGMLTESERAEVEANMAQHAAIQDAVIEAQYTMAQLTQGYAQAPKPEWRNDIISQAIAADSSTDSEVINLSATDVKSDSSSKKKSSSLGWLAVAASIALLFSLGLNFVQFNRLGQIDDALFAANSRIARLETQNQTMVANYRSMENDMAIYRDPATAQFVMNPVEGKASNLRADVLWNGVSQMAYVDVKNLPEPPSDKQYQLWALVDGKPIDMGVFNMSGEEHGLKPMQKIPGADAFAVTLEKKGGVPSPTMEQMYVYGTPLKQT
jgi:anti-sigma-K factor RskA